MYSIQTPGARLLAAVFVILFGFVPFVRAADFETATKLFEEEKYERIPDLLENVLKEYPAHDPARMLLAKTEEKLGDLDKAVKVWRDVITVTRSEDHRREARWAVSRILRTEWDKRDRNIADTEKPDDVFHIDFDEPDWEKVAVMEDSNYHVHPNVHQTPIPSFNYKSRHFSVWTYNESLSKMIAERCEIFTDNLNRHLLNNSSWSVRFPIVIYKDSADYHANGGVAGGVTYASVFGGHTTKMLMYSRGKAGKNSPTEFNRFQFDSVLEHEMLHVLMNEFFGGQTKTRWWNEGLANRYMQTRLHYQAAAWMARDVMAGRYFPLPDLFDALQYPRDMSRFYEQSSTIILYLFEPGVESMYIFLDELRKGHGADAAIAAALGIPKEGAVEELERRWVDWMRIRLLKDFADPMLEDTKNATSQELYVPSVNEMDTAVIQNDWQRVDASELDSFLGVGDSKKHWHSELGKLICDVPPKESPSMLGIRMNPVAPAALRMNVRYTGDPDSEYAWFGIGQLNFQGFDTRINVLAPLRDNDVHEIVCLWLDDLVLYVDGTCKGRYPAYLIGGNAPDVDHPLSMIAYGPVEVEDIEFTKVTEFSDKPLHAADAKEKDDQQAPPVRRGGRGPVKIKLGP